MIQDLEQEQRVDDTRFGEIKKNWGSQRHFLLTFIKRKLTVIQFQFQIQLIKLNKDCNDNFNDDFNGLTHLSPMHPFSTP